MRAQPRRRSAARRIPAHFDATVVHDGRLALRKGALGAYHAFVACDTRSARPPTALWENVRPIDLNTPFVLVCGRGATERLEQRLRVGYDALVRFPCGLNELLRAVQRLLAATERRNLQARAEEVRAVSSQIQDRLAQLEQRVRLSRQSLARPGARHARNRAASVRGLRRHARAFRPALAGRLRGGAGRIA